MDFIPPTVSVIIPVYNTEKYLSEAIESVLEQTYPASEIIVIDDGSTDSSARVAQKFLPLVQYIFQENSGTGAARNKGVELAQGEFIAFLDADDLWAQEKLQWQMDCFSSNPELDIVFGHVKQFYSPDLDEESRKKIRCPTEPMPGQLPSTMLARRSVFETIGLFETHWQIGQDMSWYMRAMEVETRTIIHPEIVHLRRLHKANKGIAQRHLVNQRLHIIKNSLDRRRQAGKI